MTVKLLLPVPLLMLSGCVIDSVRTGPLQTDSVHVARDNSEFLRVDLRMGAGDLTANPGAKDFVEGSLLYNVESWKPVVRYSTAAGHGNLTIEQPSGGHAHVGSSKYEWNLNFANDIPIDLTVHFGAGDARLNLGALSLRSVEVQMGVGQLDLDLRGAPKRDYDVRVRGGVGEATIRLPRVVGLSASEKGGIGEFHAPGLRREAGQLFNEAYDHSKVTIHLDIQGGIGQINLLTD